MKYLGFNRVFVFKMQKLGKNDGFPYGTQYSYILKTSYTVIYNPNSIGRGESRVKYSSEKSDSK